MTLFHQIAYTISHVEGLAKSLNVKTKCLQG
ncbi:hypothetical protein YGAWVPHU_CDS0016 [Salmonella phage SeKF_13]